MAKGGEDLRRGCRRLNAREGHPAARIRRSIQVQTVAETNHQEYEVIRFALVSPSDVPGERRLAKEVIADLNTNLAMPFGFVLELRQWEDVYPSLHERGAQGHIDTKLNIAECDYVVGILWHRFGTPTPSGETGTEHEVKQAHALWQKHQRPHLMLYVNVEPYSPATTGDIDQWGKVLHFKQEFQSKGVVHVYSGAADFSKRFSNHVTRIIADRVNARSSQTTALQCSVSSSLQTVRAEGISELIGEISLLFPTSPNATPLTCNIEVILNTQVTNRTTFGNVLIGAFLKRQDALSTYEVKGRIIAANRVLFERVILDLRGPNGTCEYQVVGLRANGLMIASISSDLEPTLIAFVHIQGGGGELVDVVNAAVSVANIKPSSRFEIVPSVPDPLFSRKTGINAEFVRSPATVSPDVNLWVRFVENYPGAFSTAAEESRYVREIRQDRSGTVGVHLWVCFSLVPGNTKVYATTMDRESVHGNSKNAVLIRSHENYACFPYSEPTKGDGSYEQISASGISSDGFPIAEVALWNDKACATWEWIGQPSTEPRSVAFGFVFAALPDSTLIGKTLVIGGLSPLSTIMTVSPTAPVPRFGFVSASQVAFSVVWE